jgi:hypothetical protein
MNPFVQFESVAHVMPFKFVSISALLSRSSIHFEALDVGI